MKHDKNIDGKTSQSSSDSTTSNFGLVIDWEFHRERRWVSIFTPHLVDAVVSAFQPTLITNQVEYDQLESALTSVLSMEPGWAAPRIRFSGKHPAAIMISDPHSKVGWLENYIDTHRVTHVLSQFYSPFFYHFPRFPLDRFEHFPWAVPDRFVLSDKLRLRQRSSDVSIFGAGSGDAYNLRNWCRSQKGVVSFSNSGVENKIFEDAAYFSWLQSLDAVIAAGSTKRRYQLVTPKYFEIAASGALLFGQECLDLERLGFGSHNMLEFGRWSFRKKITEYRENPEAYLGVRARGLELIRERHTVSSRVAQLRRLLKLP